MADTYSYDAMPVAVFGTSGTTQVTLQNLLTQAYGAQVSQISSVFIAYRDQNYLSAQDPDFSYWDVSPASDSVVTRVFNNGVDIGGNGTGTFNGVTVANANFSNVTIQVGNNIMPNIYVAVEWNDTAGNRIVQELNVITVPAAFQTAAATDGTPTAAEVVSFAKQFGAAYNGVVNGNDCHWIAMAVAASAGATLDPVTQVGKDVGGVFHQAPELNEEGGFWRIAYRGSQASPVDNWESLLQPGDIVRMGWTDGGFHTYTVTELDDGNHTGQVRVLDNTATNASGQSIISEHWVDYDGVETDADSITIYRLSADQRYLINGSGGNENILGTVFKDDMRAGFGNDTMSGGLGSDLYYLFDVANGKYDSVVEAAGQGTDTVWVRDVSSSVRSYAMTANVEEGVIVGAEADQFTLIGNDRANRLFDDVGNNTLVGGGGNDTLHGGNGFDFLEGGSGNDRYHLEDRNGDYDLVAEAANGGNDHVLVTPIHDPSYLDQYLMSGNVESAELLGTIDFNLFGNGIDNRLFGNAGANVIFGYSGHDSLSGHTGDDTLNGGDGNDSYYLEDLIPGDGITLAHYDATVEAANGGVDHVLVFAIDNLETFSDGYALEANIEYGTITGSRDFGLDGNELNNVLTGNSGANILQGLDGNDVLTGRAGADDHYGGIGIDTASYESAYGAGVQVIVGNNVFNTGDASGDTFDSIERLIGSKYHDTFNISSGSVTVVNAGAGNDFVNGSGNGDRLIGDIGNDTLQGGIGNDELHGGDGKDTLNGGAGNDAMNGAAGNDLFVVDSAGDRTIEAANGGTDTVQSAVTHTLVNNVERLVLAGSAAINGWGNNVANAIFGNAGSNVLNGALGNDTMTGGAAADFFTFTTALNAAANVDRITDFHVPTDSFRLSHTIFAGTGPTSTLAAGFFRSGAAAADANDRIVYNGATGELFYDKDGVGGTAQVKFAQLATGLAISNADFLII